MKTLIALCLAAVGTVGVAAPQAGAHETAPVAVQAATALPANPRVNFTVAVGVHRHRHYRTVRRVYYRHGRRVVVYRRVYY